MTTTDFDDFPLAEWSKNRPKREPKCDHLTCAGCTNCRCHVKPKRQPLQAPSQDRARTESLAMFRSVDNARRVLDKLTTRDKVHPLARVEAAVMRAYADRDAILRSPSLNGAVSGGDDPSWRVQDSMTDQNGNFVGVRFDALGNLLGQLAELVHAAETLAGTISSVIDDLNAISLADAKRLIDESSGVGRCVNPNCDTVVTGVGDDRLRAGRCDPCYRYRLRTGDDRPRRLIERENVPKEGAAS